MSESPRTTYSTTFVFGLALIAVTFVIITVIDLAVFGGGDFIAFVIASAIIAGGVTFVVWRFDALWARIVGLVATVLMVLSSFWLAFGIFYPFSPLEFVTGLMFVIGVVLAFYGGIRAILAGRHDRVGPTDSEMRLGRYVFAIIGVAALISVVGFFATKTTVSDEEAAGATGITMKDFEFAPENSSVSSGASVLLRNSDPFTHDFTLDEFDIAVTVGPGSEALVDLSSVPAGTYQYICSLHSDGESGMLGTINVGS